MGLKTGNDWLQQITEWIAKEEGTLAEVIKVNLANKKVNLMSLPCINYTDRKMTAKKNSTGTNDHREISESM